MTVKESISLLFGSGLLVTVGRFFYGVFRKRKSKKEEARKRAEEDNQALRQGVQALLRDRLLQAYDHYNEKGYAPTYAKENFENMWKNYHALGLNGVMDTYHEKFADLPDFKPEEGTE